MTNNLKPCPFCGGKASIVEYDPGAPYPGAYYGVACDNNNCEMDTVEIVFKGFEKDKDQLIQKAIKIWNRRNI